MAILTLIENALIKEISDKLPYLKTVDGLSEYLLLDIEDLPERTPAVYVVYGGGPLGLTTGEDQYEVAIFSIIAVVENMRGNTASRQGENKKKGIYDILEDTLKYLTNNKLCLEDYMTGLKPIEEVEPIGGDETFAVFGRKFQTTIRYSL